MTARSRRPLLIGALAFATLGLGAALYGSVGGSGNSAAPECRAARSATERMAPYARGEVAAAIVSTAPKPAPVIAFNGPDGQPTSLDAFKGRAVLLNLWATWCAPCRHEMPALDRLQAELGGGEFEVVAINVDTRNLEKPKTWLKDAGIARLAYYADPQGKVLQVLQRSGHVVGLPTTLILDAHGCEIAVLKGPADWASDDALRLVRAALGRL